MKPVIYRLLTALIIAATLAGCHSIKHESAMQWLQSQPMITDDP